MNYMIYFVLYWVTLGILSSVGLGTGLHTFVLFLGPHIAKFTMGAYKCKGIPLLLPSRYHFEKFGCRDTEGEFSFF